MKLYFEDQSGQRLALDTERREWAATYETDDTHISDRHFIIAVDSAEILRRIEREADFCGYGYNPGIENARARTAGASVYAEYLQRLADFVLKAEAAGTSESGPTVDELRAERKTLADRVEKAAASGYFDDTERSALQLILKDADNVIDLYDRVEQTYKSAVEQEPAPF